MRQRNLNYIQRGFPELYERIVNIRPDSVRQDFAAIEAMETVSKEIVFVLTGENQEQVRIGSAYDPRHEARIWLQAQDDIQVDNILLFGLGNGAIARTILFQKKRDSKVLIYEPSAQLFLYALQYIDMREFFDTPGVRVIVEGINEDMYSGVMEEMLTLDNYDSKVFIVAPKMAEFFPASRKFFVERYLDGVGRMMSNRNTIRRFLHLSPFNQLHNLQYVERYTTVPLLARVWEREVPIIIIGAGPSLKEEVDTLRNAGERAFLFAVDSALPYMLKEGIIPDAYICIEADKPLWFFEDERTKEIPLFCKVDTTHKLLDEHRGYKIFGKDEGFVSKFYQRYHIPESFYRYGGNGATSFFAACKELGAKNVILLGQDMAYGSDKTSHVGGRDEGFVEDDRFLYKNNQGEIVQSRQDWHRFIQWYQNAIPAVRFEHVINTAPKGVHIKGTEYMSLAQAIDSLGRKHTPMNELLAKAETTAVYNPHIDLLSFYQSCERERQQIQALTEADPHDERRKQFRVYELLRLYEIADKQNNFAESQKAGLDMIGNYIAKCMEEVG